MGRSIARAWLPHQGLLAGNFHRLHGGAPPDPTEASFGHFSPVVQQLEKPRRLDDVAGPKDVCLPRVDPEPVSFVLNVEKMTWVAEGNGAPDPSAVGIRALGGKSGGFREGEFRDAERVGDGRLQNFQIIRLVGIDADPEELPTGIEIGAEHPGDRDAGIDQIRRVERAAV